MFQAPRQARDFPFEGAESGSHGVHKPGTLSLLAVKLELALILLQDQAGAADQVVNRRSAHSGSLGNLAVGPVFFPGQVEDAPLVLGEQGPIEVEQAQVALPVAGPVKH
jgi:hypothetical protein